MLSMIVRAIDGAKSTVILTEEPTRLEAVAGSRYELYAGSAPTRPGKDVKVLRFDDDLVIDGLPDSGAVTIAGFFANCEQSACTLQLDGYTGKQITPDSEPINALRLLRMAIAAPLMIVTKKAIRVSVLE